MSDILAMARAHGLGPYKKKGAEYHGECPNCGGKDRHWLTPTGGKDGTGVSGCRHCDEANCRSIEFGVRFCGLTRNESVAFLGLKSSGRKQHTLEALSRQKKLPVEFLRSLGIREAEGKNAGNLEMPYFQADGTSARSQIRSYGGSQWWNTPDERPIVPYGLDRRGTSTWVILNEGCSDSWTFWHHGFQSLGIPGSTMHGKLTIEHLEGVDRVYVFKEDDDKDDGTGGGKTFKRNILKCLSEIGYKGRIFIVDMADLGAKDASALHIADPAAFPEKIQKALDDATPGEGQAWLPPIGGPMIPALVYDGLPADLRRACLLLRAGHESDVFMTGLWPVLSAALPNVLTKYNRQWKALAISTAVIAPAGAGKSPLRLAGDCAEAIDARLREASAKARCDWAELGEDERKGKPEPPERSLRLAVDTSTRGLLDNLAANGGRGLLFETEIKTLADTFRQDWGSFKSILLKAAEQEPIERVRKGEDKLYIRKPELPMAISGTPRGLTEWIGSTEDGIFSRFLFYVFDAKPEWVDQFDDDEDEALDKALAQIGDTLDKMHEALSGRASDDEGKPTPLYFRFEHKQRRRLNAVFSRRLQAVSVTERTELFASVKRGAFQAVRIAGALAAYRLHAAGKSLSIIKSYTPEDDEVDAAIALVCCYLDHAAALSLRFEQDPRAKIKSEDRWRFFEALPQEFSTATALEIGQGQGMSRSGVERALRALTERHGLFTRLRQGWYRKSSFGTEGLTEVKEAKEVGPENEAFPSVPSVPSLPSGPSIPSERQNGRNETPGGDEATTSPPVLADPWDSAPTSGMEGDV